MELDSCTLKPRALMMLSGLYLHPVTLLLAVYQFVFFLLQMSFSHVVAKEASSGSNSPCFHLNRTRGHRYSLSNVCLQKRLIGPTRHVVPVNDLQSWVV